MNRNFRNFLVTTTILFGSQVNAGNDSEQTHYRWLDSRGEPVYSDLPPPKGIDYEVISNESAFKRVVSKDEGAVPREVQPTVTNDFEPVDASDTEKTEKNPVLCEKAEMNLIALQTNRELTVRNEKGEAKALSAEGREAAMQNAKQQISLYCE